MFITLFLLSFYFNHLKYKIFLKKNFKNKWTLSLFATKGKCSFFIFKYLYIDFWFLFSSFLKMNVYFILTNKNQTILNHFN